MKANFDRNRMAHFKNTSNSYKKLRSSLDASPRVRNRQSQDNIPVKYLKEPWRKITQKQNRNTFKNKLKTLKQSLSSTKNNSPQKTSPLEDSIANISNIKSPNINLQYRYFYQIGLGAFGKVWKVQDKETGVQYALKVISKQRVLQQNCVAAIFSEKAILSQINHNFIVNMHRCFQDRDNIYILLDYLRGADLRYHICYKQKFTQNQIKFIIACVVIALEKVHSHHIIHRDVKPQNIIFDQFGYLRLTDFGIAKTSVALGSKVKTDSCGTPVYMAPQLLFKQEYSYESDFYALGVIIFELIMGKRPYTGKSRAEIRSQLLNKQICISRFQVEFKCSEHLMSLVNKLLKKNPAERLGFKGIHEIKEHPFFSDIKWKKIQKKQVIPPYVPNIISQTKQYLSQISLFNQMRNRQISAPERVDSLKNQIFANFDFNQTLKKPKLPKEIKKIKKHMTDKKMF